MRKVIVGAFVSLDGVMQAPGGPDEDREGGFALGGWTAPFWDDAIAAAMAESFSRPFDLLLGRKTYDIFAAHWPRVASDPSLVGNDESSVTIAKTFDAITKYVATRSPDTLRWQNSQALGRDVVSAVRALKQGSGPDLLTQGSSQLLQALLASDVVDELRLLTYPVVLGNGKRLFGASALPAAFEVSRSVSSPSGVVIATYRRAGAVKTGSFELPDSGGK